MIKTEEQTVIIPDGNNGNIFNVIRCFEGGCFDCGHELVGEDPLLIRIEDKPYAAVMRTPGEETFPRGGILSFRRDSG